MGFVGGVFLLLTLPALARTKVVNDFKECADSFLRVNNEIVYPTIFTEVDLQTHDRYQKICQMRNSKTNNKHKYEFATLYDTSKKIPVYSAYKFDSTVSTTKTVRNENWYIEPQNPLKNSHTINIMGKYQALLKDYETSGYDKGHLFPVSHAATQETVDATFTLTNAVPQDRCLNEIWWREMELKVRTYYTTKCIKNSVYVVTGASGSVINGELTVPVYLWTAFCCSDITTRQWVSKAHFAKNDNSQIVKEYSVEDLEKKLTICFKTDFSIFQNKIIRCVWLS
uniref:Endonuclease domain-containing 1 protein-like n=1 Tax=Hucho hucho TaxID=62062 RepID=A0A4W5LT58_9TELE